MKNILVFALLVISTVANAQITITSDEFPELGDENRVEIKDFQPDSFPMQLFDLRYDTFFVNISDVLPDTVINQDLIEPKDAEGGSEIKNADMAFNTSLGVTFFKEIGDSLMVVGVTPVLFDLPSIVGFPFNEPVIYYSTPMSFDSIMYDSTTTKQDFGIAKIEIALKMSYVVNGHGQIKTNGGLFDVLRMRRTFDLKIKTIPLFGDPVEQEALYVNWEFLTTGEQWPILRAATILDNVAGGQDTIVRFETLVTTSVGGNSQIIDPFEVLSFHSYIKINSHENDLLVNIMDLQGRIVSNTFLHKTEEEVSLSDIESGLYIIHCEDLKTGNVISKKIYKN